MATVDATPMGADANSYVTLTEAAAYYDERLSATLWDDASADDRARAVIMATRAIDDTYRFAGWRTTSLQALKWPRTNVWDEDGEEYATNVTPELVKRATLELALKMLTDSVGGTDSLAGSGLEQFRRAKVGPMEVEIDKGFSASSMPDHVRRILAPLLESAGMFARLERS